MAAPSTTTRITPAGIMLWDGYSSKVALAADPDISFWEKTIQPPSYDMGDPIDITNMYNVTYRVSRMRQLVSVGEVTLVAAYDPNVVNNILAIIGKEDDFTILYPDGSKEDFWGGLRMFERGELTEGEQPEATVVITVTNYDPTNNVEAGPVMTSAPGT